MLTSGSSPASMRTARSSRDAARSLGSRMIFAGLLVGFLTASAKAAPESSLLFYLSGNHGTTADVSAKGLPRPTFDHEVMTIADGFKGPALQCGDLQLLAWRAPGNLYAQRGTVAFAWRSRYPVGPIEFPIFRVAFADQSSWDMVWLRIDYNGHGFDAFVTDPSLARTRVSVTIEPFPPPSEWIHLALSWDETRGIRFYVNGRLAAQQDTVAMDDTGLDQFGTHSRVISHHNVLSEANFVRGGDIDELRIYDRMLGDEHVAALSVGEVPVLEASPPPGLEDAATRVTWDRRYGWERPEERRPRTRGPP